MSLRPLQEEFLAFLEGGDSAVSARIVGSDQSRVERMLDVYYRAYRIRLEDALRDNFPAVHFVLGDEDFSLLSNAYFASRRPSTHTLRDVGDRLAQYLRDTAPFSGQPVFSDLAAFEWALRNAFDAADGEHLCMAALREVAPQRWGELVFSLHPSVQVVPLASNAAQIWQAFSEERELPPPQVSPSVQWVVWRSDLRSYFRSLDDDEALLLGLLGEGCSFAAACAAVEARWGGEAAEKVAATLGQFINEGWFLSA